MERENLSTVSQQGGSVTLVSSWSKMLNILLAYYQEVEGYETQMKMVVWSTDLIKDCLWFLK